MKDAIKMMESNMSPEAVRRAHIKAEQDIMSIRLAQLREEMNIKQSEMENFTQSSVSQMRDFGEILAENRKKKGYENIYFNRLSRQSWNGLRNNYIPETCCFKETGKSTVKSVAKPNKGS